MVANNLKAFAIHLLIIIICWYISWTASDNVILFVVFSTLPTYFLSGFFLLKPTVKYAFLSVSSVFFILLINAIVELKNDGVVMSPYFFNPMNWWLDSVFSFHSIYFFTSAIPSLAMYMGILARRWYASKNEHWVL